MSTLPYKKGDIPMDSLRAPHNERSASYRTTASEAAPPAHHMHPHSFNDDHYYQGMDPGYQGDSAENTYETDDQFNTSGSRTHQYDTLIDKEKRSGFADDNDTKSPHHQHPHTAGSEGLHSDSDDETDDFDWDTSDNEDFEGNDDSKLIRAKRGRKLYLALMRLARPVRIFAIGVAGTIIALIPFIVVLAAFRQKPARDQVETWSIWLAIVWAAGCGTFIVVDMLPPFFLKIGVAFYGKAPETFKTAIEILIAIKIWLKLVLCISWAWISLGGVTAISFTPSSRPAYFKYIFRVLQAFFGTSILVLVEKVLLQTVAIHFHKTALKDRLESNRAAIKALDALHESKYLANGQKNKRRSGQWAKSFGWTSGSGPGTPRPAILGGHGTKSGKDPRDSPTAQRKQYSPLNDREARKSNFANQLTDALATATMKGSRLYRGKETRNQLSARRLAKQLFTAIGHHRQRLVADDFYPFFATPEESQAAFKHFDADNNGDISKVEMRDAVQGIYRERRSLSTQLKDMSSAISKLDGVLLGVVLVIVIFLWLLIFNGSNTVANIAPLSTFVVSFSFVFGNSAKTLFESMVFIFATHPYDVGDLVCVDDNFMFVTSFGLISTTFRTVVNEYIVVPNSLLATQKMIFNCRRSGSQWEVTTIQVGYDSTLLEMIDDLRAKMRAWVKTHDREWAGGFDVNIDQLETSSNAVSLILAMEHKGNWQDWGSRWSKRTQLMRQVKLVCEELGLKYQLPMQPVSFHRQNGVPGSAPLPSSTGPRSFAAARGSPRPVGGVGNLQYSKVQQAAMKTAS